MKFSIVIPTKERHQALLDCVDSCLNLKAWDGEIIVVSDGEDPILRHWLEPLQEHHPFLRYCESPSGGANQARNFGAARARGDWIVFLDDDCRIADPDYLEKAEVALLNNPDAVAVGGPYSLRARAGWLARYYVLLANTWLYIYRGPSGEAERLLGGNTIYRREIFLRDWAFDPEIRYGGAESEFQERLRGAGHRFLCDESLAVEHGPVLSLSELSSKAWRQGRARSSLPSDAQYFSRILRAVRGRPMLVFNIFCLLPFFLIGQVAYWFGWTGRTAEVLTARPEGPAKVPR